MLGLMHLGMIICKCKNKQCFFVKKKNISRSLLRWQMKHVNTYKLTSENLKLKAKEKLKHAFFVLISRQMLILHKVGAKRTLACPKGLKGILLFNFLKLKNDNLQEGIKYLFQPCNSSNYTYKCENLKKQQ